MIVTNVRWDAVGCGGRDGALDERRWSVRQRRVVLTPVCWRQVLKKLTLPRGDGDKQVLIAGASAL